MQKIVKNLATQIPAASAAQKPARGESASLQEAINRLEQEKTQMQSELDVLITIRQDNDTLRTEVKELKGHAERLDKESKQNLERLEHKIVENRQLLEHLNSLKQTNFELSEERARLLTHVNDLPLANEKGAVLFSKLLSKIELLEAATYSTKKLIETKQSSDGAASNESFQSIQLYLDLLENSLTGVLLKDISYEKIAEPVYNPDRRLSGLDWPVLAKTMIGRARMRNLRVLTERVLAEKIPGDLIETGVWRGGACIYLRGILKAYGATDRKVWLADSFEGLPPPDAAAYPQDAGDEHHSQKELVVSLDEVKENFALYDLLDEQVEFLPGWFKDTLSSAPIDRLAILRLDGDMYQSTWEAMTALYGKLSSGGYLIVDDYNLNGSRKAIDDYRREFSIVEPIHEIDGSGVYWRKG